MADDMVLASKAIRFLNETELKLIVQDKELEITEWENVGYTFLFSRKYLGIVRTGIMGGDVREIHGGWKYISLIHMWQEWQEICQVSNAYRSR